MFPIKFGPHDTFQVFQLYPISWLISNNEYGIIVNLGLKYGKTASAFYLHGTLWLVWVKKCYLMVLVLRGRAFRTQMSWDRWRSIHRFGFNPPPLTHPVFKRQLSVVVFCRSFL